MLPVAGRPYAARTAPPVEVTACAEAPETAAATGEDAVERRIAVTGIAMRPAPGVPVPACPPVAPPDTDAPRADEAAAVPGAALGQLSPPASAHRWRTPAASEAAPPTGAATPLADTCLLAAPAAAAVSFVAVIGRPSAAAEGSAHRSTPLVPAVARPDAGEAAEVRTAPPLGAPDAPTDAAAPLPVAALASIGVRPLRAAPAARRAPSE